MMVQAAEPLILKGAELLTIPKGKGDASCCDSSRGIILQSTFAKVLQRTTRGLMHGRFEADALQMQLGSRKGLTALYGAMSARAFLAFARKKGWSAALIFFDISSAFYAVVRELVTGMAGQAFDISAVARGLHLTKADLQGMAHVIAEDPILGSDDAGSLLCGLASDIHTATWFSLRDDDAIIRTRRGSRPGSPWADLIFGVLFSRVIRCSQSLQDEKDSMFIPAVPWDGKRSVRASSSDGGSGGGLRMDEIIFADDLAVCGACGHACNLTTSTSRLAAAVLDAFYSHGLKPNMGPQKTSTILAPCGPHSRQVRHSIFNLQGARLPVLLENAGSVLLDVVPHYKHLGCKITYDAAIDPEVVRRLQLGRDAFKEGKKLAYCNKRVSLTKRATLFRDKILAMVLHGAGAWPKMRDSTFLVFRRGILSMYRQLLTIPPHEDQKWITAQIVSAVDLPQPQVLLHIERARFAALMFRTAPDVVWAVSRTCDAFIEALQHAFAWVFSQVALTCTLPDPSSSADALDEWLMFARDRPGKWKGLLKRAACLDGQTVHIRAFMEMQLREVWPQHRLRQHPQATCWEHACFACMKAFPSRQAWAVHAAKTHGIKAPYTLLARGRQCQSCGRIYADSGRLSIHLRAMPYCMKRVQILERMGLLECRLSGCGHSQAPVMPPPADFVPAVLDDSFQIPSLLQQQLHDCDIESADDVVALVRAAPQPFASALQTVVDCIGADRGRDVLLREGLQLLRGLGSGITQAHHVEAEPLDDLDPFIIPLRDPPLMRRCVLTFGQPDREWLFRLGDDFQIGRCCASISELLRLFHDFTAVWCSFAKPPLQGEEVWKPLPSTIRQGRRHMLWCRQLLLVWTLMMRASESGVVCGLAFHDVQPSQLGLLYSWSCQAGAMRLPAHRSCGVGFLFH